MQEEGLINGFQVVSNGEGFPILQFADDALIFANGDIKEAKVVKNVLI